MPTPSHNVCLIVIDGWGIPNAKSQGDAITNAHTPVMDELSKNAAGYTKLEASGLAVGLPEGLMGNSETGHLNIGAGRPFLAEAVKLDDAARDGTIGDIEEIAELFKNTKKGNGRLHLCGLVSDGGVHAKQTHLHALLEAAKAAGLKDVFVHFFADGRDTDPQSGAGYLEQLLQKMEELGIGQVSTVVGRYYAMDRDKRWGRVQMALNGMVFGEGEISEDPVQTMRNRYKIDGKVAGNVCTDEFFQPIIVGDVNNPDSIAKSRIREDDKVLFFNYRSDRARQIAELLGDTRKSRVPDEPLVEYPYKAKESKESEESKKSEEAPKPDGASEPPNPAEPADSSEPSKTFIPRHYPEVEVTTMTEYKKDWPFKIAIQPKYMPNVLAEWLGKQGVKQVHVAETEKYAHVTFFFNGGVEEPYLLETRDATQDLVPSNGDVTAYDQAPEMSADGVAKQVVKRLSEKQFPFVMNNFAPPDMVGHSGVYEAALIACEVTDKGIGMIRDACKKEGYILFVTSDHGNAEEMKTDKGKPKTSHTLNKVPFIMDNAPEGWSLKQTEDAALRDVAPTILTAMGLPLPADMTGQNLLVKP
ncbi:metalloenzyme [Nemania sp. FL0916]|nr:metalloenzyme [Nemania sp. FL0916]